MQQLSYYLGVSKQTEVLLLTLIGICYTIFDASLLDFSSNLHKVWNVALDSTKVSENLQMYLKYLLSGIILVRSFTVHLYLAFYIVMLWPAIFEERPGLLLPWLIVGAIKSLGMGLLSFCLGMFTCFAYGFYRPACLDFVIAEIIDQVPSFYMWCCVLSYYRELKMCATVITSEKSKTDLETEITIRRRKVRSMADNISLKHHCPIDEERHLISVSTIENIVQQLATNIQRKATRSLDSLLGVMAAEAEKEELMNLCDDLPPEEQGLTIPEKTAKLLKLTKQDIIEAQSKKKVGDGVALTSPMLDIQNNKLELYDVHTAEKVPDLAKATYRTLSLPADSLRITKSENGNITHYDLSKYSTTTEFMSNISETEIRNVLNYSSISLVTKNEQEVTPQLLLLSSVITDIQEVEPPGKHVNVEVIEEQSVINEQQVMHSKTSDVGCQASTLSRSILKSSFPLQRYIEDRPTPTYKKTSRRTPLTKPPGQDAPRLKKDNNSKREGNYKKAIRKEVREIIPAKVEISKNTSLFKIDGYTMAYNERMRATLNTEKTLMFPAQDKLATIKK